MKKWINIPSLFWLFACLLPVNQVNAASLFQNHYYDDWSSSEVEVITRGLWYFSLGAGGTFPSVKDNYYVPTAPGWPNDHYVRDNTDGGYLMAIGAGYTINRLDQDILPFVSLGLKASLDFYSTVSGHIEQYSLPQMNNYNYSYKIHSQTLLAVLKADLINYHNFMPYLSVGAGYSQNKFSNYQESPLNNVTPRVSPGFNQSINSYFTYTVGAGVDYILYPNVWLSADYYYGDYGYVQSSNGDNPPTLTGNNFRGDNLKSRLTANTVLFTVTYLQG